MKNGRNDLEELGKYSRIVQGSDFLSFEATDDNRQNSAKDDIEIPEALQEATSVFSQNSGTVSEIDGIISASDNSEPATDILAEADEAFDEQDTFVWIPKSGKKYHSKAECSNMSSPSKVSLSMAESRGYTACKKCY